MTVASRCAPERRERVEEHAMTNPALDEALIEQLILDRIDARRARDFAKADSIRQTLDAMGLIIIDGKDEETGEFWTTWDVRPEGEETP
jgi:cysteinyl-tRNA synthetase